jgi:Ca-activated chloride channel family protein
MHRSLLAAALIATSALVVYAAVPLRVSSPAQDPPAGRHETDAPARQQGQSQAAPAASTTIAGDVRDAQGRPLAGAVVEAVHKGGTWRALALTDREGRFSLTSVPRGDIELTVRRDTLQFEQVISTSSGPATVALRAPDAVAQLAYSVRAPTPSIGIAPPQSADVARMSAEAMVASRATTAFMHPREPEPTSMDAYARLDPSGFRRSSEAPLSTFSVDVDTASYSNGRRFLMEGRMPPADAVRVEEWVNYFSYGYPSPEGRDAFRVSTALTACPWNREHQLLRVGVRGRPVPRTDAPAKNLVFLVDVSGSMMSPDRLPLVRTSLRMLADQLTARDRIALVVYAARTAVVLPSTPGDQKPRIHQAIEQLEAGGSTNGAGGIQLAYQAARDGFVKGGVNRVVLATDGDFNVGVTSLGDLTRLIEQERESGVSLSVLGVGRGNLKDSTLEALADRGNGNYAYVDSLQEARRVLVEQVGATLVTIAKDVKLQIEFNPTHVAAYRLIGYENRTLQAEDFANDAKDAGEIGAGHTVTALYEIVPPGREGSVPRASTLRYQQTAPSAAKGGDELATVSVRHKAPDGGASVLQSHAVPVRATEADADTAFAMAVAEAAMVLRRDPLATQASLASALARAQSSLGADPGGWRAEFVRLMQLASSLQSLQAPPTSEPQD